MTSGTLTPGGEVTAAYGAAMVAAFQVLINCLEENDARLPGHFSEALGVYMEMVRCSTIFGRPRRISRWRKVDPSPIKACSGT